MRRFLALLCAALLCGPAFSAPRHGGVAPSGGGGSPPTVDAGSFASGIFEATTSGTCTITTPGTNRTIVVGVAASNTSTTTSMNVSSVADTSSLTWHSTTALVDNVRGTKNLELWWAYAASVVTSDTITVTIANAVDAATIGCVSFAGANASAPMDPGGGTTLPRGASDDTSTFGAPTVTNVSTTATNSLILGMATENSGSTGCGTASAGAGFTVIGSMVINGNGAAWYSCLMMEYMTATSAQSGLTVATCSSWPFWAMRVDALKP